MNENEQLFFDWLINVYQLNPLAARQYIRYIRDVDRISFADLYSWNAAYILGEREMMHDNQRYRMIRFAERENFRSALTALAIYRLLTNDRWRNWTAQRFRDR